MWSTLPSITGAGRQGAGRVWRPGMLGEALIDTAGHRRQCAGLGLLPLVTALRRAKTVQRTLQGSLAPCPGVCRGCRVWPPPATNHHGQTAQHPAMAAKGRCGARGHPRHRLAEPGRQCWRVPHGLFEDACRLHRARQVPTLDSVFDGLAGFLGTSFTPGVLDALAP